MNYDEQPQHNFHDFAHSFKLPVCTGLNSCQCVKVLRESAFCYRRWAVHFQPRSQNISPGSPEMSPCLSVFCVWRERRASGLRCPHTLMSASLFSAVTRADCSGYRGILTPLAPSDTNTSDLFGNTWDGSSPSPGMSGLTRFPGRRPSPWLTEHSTVHQQTCIVWSLHAYIFKRFSEVFCLNIYRLST